jgi:hypothetical protein
LFTVSASCFPRPARRGSAVEARTVFAPTSIRIERLMAVGGIGRGQAVSGLYARGRRDWQPPKRAVRVTRSPPRFCQPISRCDWRMASQVALRVSKPVALKQAERAGKSDRG